MGVILVLSDPLGNLFRRKKLSADDEASLVTAVQNHIVAVHAQRSGDILTRVVFIAEAAAARQ